MAADGAGPGTASGAAAPPLWTRLARTLRSEIAAGAHPVGGVLPPELALARLHGVSRETVRRALAALRAEGLIVSRRGVGARVAARAPEAGRGFSLGSLDEVERFAEAAVFHVDEAEEVRATGRLAARLGCRPGKVWLRLGGVRIAVGRRRPLSLTQAHIDLRYAAGLAEARAHAASIISTIERLHGERVVEARQSFSAALIDTEAARRLEAEEGAPALLVSRRYFGAGGRLIEATTNLHPADRFDYEMTLHRAAAAQEAAP